MKKLLYFVFFISLCFLVNINNVAATKCTYKNLNDNSKKSFEFKDECPIIVNEKGKTVDIEKNQITESDDYYILSDYNIIFGKNANNYSGQIAMAQAYYGGTKNAYGYDQNFIISFNEGSFKANIKQNGYNFTNKISKQNFFNSDFTNFKAHEYLYFTSKYDIYATENIVLYESMSSISEDDKIYAKETKLISNFIIYETNPTVTVLDTKNYCGTNSQYTLTLYSDNKIVVSGPNNPNPIKGDSLPESICVITSSINNSDISTVSLGECSHPSSILGQTYGKCDIKDADQVEEETEFFKGTTYQYLLGKLKPAINALNPITLSIKLHIGTNPNATLNDVQANNGLCSGNECFSNSSYLTEIGLKEIRQYCNEVYNTYPDYKNNDDMKNRMDECVGFNAFYSELVKRGIINNLGDGCDIITEELAEKLDFILDIVKIAGPLLALGLGTFDFIKVIANGDADKEMKTAFKRFMTRLGAAALLFIIPFVIAFLLDIFMRPGEGYESDNPFCSVIDWDE